MSDGLSQAEIDALMNGGSAAAEDDSKEEKVEERRKNNLKQRLKKKPWKMQRLTLTMRSSPAWTNRLEWT